MNAIENTIAENIAAIKAKIAKINQGTEIIAVSKNHTADSVRHAIAAGQILFGENRVQEAKAKFVELKKEFPQIKLHLIGPLQTNKVKEALQLFDVIQTLDREKLVLAIVKEIGELRIENKETEKPRFSPLVSREFFIQVNIGNEPQKAGIAPEQAVDFYNFCTTDLGLNVTGLMCIPPVNENPKPFFSKLKAIAKELEIRDWRLENGKNIPNLQSPPPNLQLSMGMSADYEVAAQMGANYVRIGTAIFGGR